jgi:SAM-dependent methyltransferase
MREQDLAARSQADWYFGSGCRDALRVLQDLANTGFELRHMKTVLELGCGSSRVLRWLRNVGGLELHGSDANPKPIAWGQRNLPGIHFHHNHLQPPLALADESCDCVYALSVFTHIPLEWQAAWLQELRRILRLDGYVVCTVASVPYVHEQLDEQERHAFEAEGKLTLTASNPHASYSSQVLGSWDVFQSRDEVRRCFSEGFQILTYTDQRIGQDRLVLKKVKRPS